MRFLSRTICAAGLLALTPPAWAAADLDCMARDASVAETEQIENFYQRYDMRNAPASVQMIDPVIAARAEACTARHRWSAAAASAAVEHRRAALIREALRRRSPATPEGLAAMDAAIAAANPVTLRLFFADVSAGRGAMNTAALAVVLPIFEASGLPMTRDNGVFVGSWMTATFLMQDREATFANS